MEQITKKGIVRIVWNAFLTIVATVLFFLTFPIWGPVVLVISTYIFLNGVWLRLLVRRHWYPQGKYLLFVYSDSPNWKEYIEENILPRISDRAVVLNWSERSDWDWKRKPLALRVFKHWAGVRRSGKNKKEHWYARQYNPVAIVFHPWWKSHVFRFFKPLRDYKHGKQTNLRQLEESLYSLLDNINAQ